MDITLPIQDLKVFIGGLQSVSLTNPHYEKYEIRKFEGKKYVIGYNPCFKTNPLLSLDKPILLFSLISLAKKLPSIYLTSDPVKQKLIEAALPEKDVKKFCRKFGMPYEVGMPKHFYPVIDDILIELNTKNMAFFELDRFRWNVFVLREYFEVWVSLVMPDQYSINDSDKIIDKYLEGWHEEPRSVKEKEAAAKDKLAKELAMKAEGVQIIPVYDRVKNAFIMATRSRDLLSVAYFQFMGFLTRPPAEIKASLKTCENCRGWFWGRENRKVCYFCTRQGKHRKNKEV